MEDLVVYGRRSGEKGDARTLEIGGFAGEWWVGSHDSWDFAGVLYAVHYSLMALPLRPFNPRAISAHCFPISPTGCSLDRPSSGASVKVIPVGVERDEM